ncbi:MAG: hypothetical protein AAGA30_14785, partial [Planctomycetota bacterium]
GGDRGPGGRGGGFGGGDRGPGGRGGSGGGPGGRGGGGGPNATKIAPVKVELPVYRLNDSRARIKTVLVTARNFFLREASVQGRRTKFGIYSVANQEQQNRIEEEIVTLLDELLKETELGVVDYKKLKGEEPDLEDITDRLRKVYSKGAKSLQRLMKNPPKAPGPAGGGLEDELAGN